jgi:hypothetical protein
VEPSLPSYPCSIVGGNRLQFLLFFAELYILAYLPVFNNSFISDDYVIFGHLNSLRHDALTLFAEPPECLQFRRDITAGKYIAVSSTVAHP